MPDTKHTQERWYYGSRFIQDENGLNVAEVFSGPDDGRLIASAPEMLEALMEARDDLICRTECARDCDMVERWGKIIAKATGEEG